MRREFVCPRCGLVLEANAVEGVVWMGEHVAQCAVPARATFTALGDADVIRDATTGISLRLVKSWDPSKDCDITEADAIALGQHFARVRDRLPLAFTWAETLSVADAEFLHGLGIDPT